MASLRRALVALTGVSECIRAGRRARPRRRAFGVWPGEFLESWGHRQIDAGKHDCRYRPTHRRCGAGRQYGDIPSEAARSRWRGRTIGVVYQSFSCSPPCRCSTTSCCPWICAGCSTSARPQRARELLVMVGRRAHVKRPPRSRAAATARAIARALATTPAHRRRRHRQLDSLAKGFSPSLPLARGARPSSLTMMTACRCVACDPAARWPHRPAW